MRVLCNFDGRNRREGVSVTRDRSDATTGPGVVKLGQIDCIVTVWVSVPLVAVTVIGDVPDRIRYYLIGDRCGCTGRHCNVWRDNRFRHAHGWGDACSEVYGSTEAAEAGSVFVTLATGGGSTKLMTSPAPFLGQEPSSFLSPSTELSRRKSCCLEASHYLRVISGTASPVA